MRKLLTGLLCALVVGGFTDAGAQTGLKSIEIGGGFLWNDGEAESWQKSNDGLVRASATYQATRIFALSPYVEYAAGDGESKTIGGLQLIYSTPLDDTAGTLYLGPGVGAVKTDGSTELLASGIAGIRYPMSDRLGLFFQSEYSYATGSVLEGFTMHAGVFVPLSR
jgi:hypothetical protein